MIRCVIAALAMINTMFILGLHKQPGAWFIIACLVLTIILSIWSYFHLTAKDAEKGKD